MPALPWRLEVREAAAVIGSQDLLSLGPIAIVATTGVTMSMTGGPTFDPATEWGGS